MMCLFQDYSKHLWFIFVILCFLSCAEKKSIKGSWIYSYELHKNGVVSFSPNPVTIFDIGHTSMTAFTIVNEDDTINENSHTYQIKKTGNTYKFGEQYLLDANAVKGDSLVLRPTKGGDGNLIVCRRLPMVKEYAK